MAAPAGAAFFVIDFLQRSQCAGICGKKYWFFAAMTVDVIIVGQGICGSLLAWNLQQAGKTVLVIDEPRQFTASKVASGVINPVTGRRIVRTWMIESLLPFAWKAYQQLEAELGVKLVRQCNLLDFHPTPQMKLAFDKRMDEGETYLKQHDAEDWKNILDFHFGIGEIDPCLLIDINLLLQACREKLSPTNSLLEASFDHSQLEVTGTGFSYQNITEGQLVFCAGMEGFRNPYFNLLPYAANKGEVLIAEIPGLPRANILKQGLSIVPWKDDLFWIGSSYQWEFENDQPTEAFRKRTEAQLTHWLKIPFTITDHWAAVRPATIERRPFAGFHPTYNNIGILNGMGTKGCSLAPWFAHQLTRHMVDGDVIDPHADVQRFKRILTQPK